MVRKTEVEAEVRDKIRLICALKQPLPAARVVAGPTRRAVAWLRLWFSGRIHAEDADDTDIDKELRQ